MDFLQNFLLFMSSICIYWISKDGRHSKMELQKFTRTLEKSIKNSNTSGMSLTQKLIDDYQFYKDEFKGIYLKEDSVSFLMNQIHGQEI